MRHGLRPIQWLAIFAVVQVGACVTCRGDMRSLLSAIRQVESGGNCNAVGDGGRSIGAYQIRRGYWRDASVPGWYGDVRTCAYAERVMVAYWRRYCPAALARGDWETLARTHNGGPSGARKASTRAYWVQVRRAMR